MDKDYVHKINVFKEIKMKLKSLKCGLLGIALLFSIGLASANEFATYNATLPDGKTTVEIWWGRYSDDGSIKTVFGRNITCHNSHSTEPFHLKRIEGTNFGGQKWSIIENEDETWNIKGITRIGQHWIDLKNIMITVKDYKPADFCEVTKDKSCGIALEHMSRDTGGENGNRCSVS